METKPAFTHTYLLKKNISIQFLTEKMERNNCQLATEVVVLESSITVVVMESEFPLFSYPWEHFSFAPISKTLNSVRS